MKRTLITLLSVILTVTAFLSCKQPVKENAFDPVLVEKEIVQKYTALNCQVGNTTPDFWGTYFLNHPNIGNIYDNNVKLGWETYYKGIQKFLSQPVNEIISFYDLHAHPINAELAWVDGKYKIEKGDGTVEIAIFYDTLIKTEIGWKVIVSVVDTGEEKQ